MSGNYAVNANMFDLSTIFPKNIIVFGAGGGGSRTILELPSFLFEANAAGLCSLRQGSAPKIHIVDHDVVEGRNCFRQAFLPWDVGELKVSALKNRMQGLLEINAIPEASNASTLPLIFTEELLSQPFCVISKLDHAISTSQIYTWLLENAPATSTWTWFFSGTSLMTQKIKGVFREIDHEIKLPYVTAYMYGRVKGQPIVPDLTDTRFAGISPRPFPPHVAHTDVIVDTTGITGRQSDGGGCGMSDGDRVEQASLGNLSSTLMTMKQLRSLYIDGIVIPEIIEENGVTQAILPYTLDEVFFPDQFPSLVNLLSQDQTQTETQEVTENDNTSDYIGTDSIQPEASESSREGDESDSPTDPAEFVWDLND
jgi:hypothetical protein